MWVDGKAVRHHGTHQTPSPIIRMMSIDEKQLAAQPKRSLPIKITETI